MPDVPRRDALWGLTSLAAGQVLSMGLGFVGFAYLARTLPAESYGLIEYAVGLCAIGAIVIEGGLGPVGVLEISKARDRVHQIASNIVAVRFLLSLVVVSLIGLSTVATETGRSAGLIWLYAFALFAVPLKQDWLLQALDRMPYVAPAQSVRSAVFALGVIVVVDGASDIVEVGLIEVAAAFCGAMYYLGAQRAVEVTWSLRVQTLRAWPLVRAGAGLGASNIVWTFMLYLPILLVTNLAGSEDAAWLGGAQRIVYSLVAFGALYFFNLYPAIARGMVRDRTTWEHLIGCSFRIVAWTSLGAALMGTVLADILLVTVFGRGFAPAAPVFAVYIWLFPIRLMAGHARWTLVAAQRQRHVLLSELGSAFVLVTVGTVLVAAYSALGAAVAVLVANVTGWLCVEFFAARHVGRLPGPTRSLVPLAAAAGSLLLAVSLGGDPLSRLVLAAACYSLCAYVFAPSLLADGKVLAAGRSMDHA